MDLEARLIDCMETIQGWDTKPDFNKGAFKGKGPGSDMAAVATHVAAKANGMAFKVEAWAATATPATRSTRKNCRTAR